MAKDYAKQFYKSLSWIQCRASFIAERRSIDGGMCQRCHNNLGYIVHHKIYLTPDKIDDPNVSLNYNNLEYLCLECHNQEHTFGPRYKPLLCKFDEKGRPINGET